MTTLLNVIAGLPPTYRVAAALAAITFLAGTVLAACAVYQLARNRRPRRRGAAAPPDPVSPPARYAPGIAPTGPGTTLVMAAIRPGGTP